MKSNLLRLFRRARLSPCITVCLLTCCTHLLAQEATTYPVVRLDLNAGSFLNPLPFDRPFLIQGHASQGISRIQVTFEDFLDTGHFFSEQPNRVAAFEAGAQALLDSMLLGPRTAENASNLNRVIERGLNNLLWQHTSGTGGLSVSDAMNVLPWNWGNWMQGKKSKTKKLLTTGTLFDPSNAGDLPRQKFRTLIKTIQDQSGSQKGDALDRLVDFVVNEAQSVRIVSVPNVPTPTTQVMWQNLHNRRSIHKEPLQTEPSSRWNRLEQRLQGDTVTDTEEFRLVVSPLEANRTYRVQVQTEGSSSVDSMQSAPLTTYFFANSKSSDYISLDVGLLYAREIKETSVYVGTNFYLRPVAKSVPLRTRGGFLRRFAFTIGLAFQDIEDDRSTRSALIGPMSLVLGAGIRLSKYVRLGGGALVFRERDPETFPLTTRTSLASSPYISASFDVDVGKQVRGLGGLFGIFETGGGE